MLNDWLTEYALENAIGFLNMNLLVSKNSFLRDELTYDGIHPSARGYGLEAPEVGKVLAKHKL